MTADDRAIAVNLNAEQQFGKYDAEADRRRRMTAQDAIDREMKKLADMGITVNVTTAQGGEPTGVSAVMKDAAQRAGIYYEEEQ